jgi:hypothetical protein
MRFRSWLRAVSGWGADDMASRFTAPIKRIETAKGHHYKDATGQRVPGVTTIIGDGVPKPALINWAANVTAEYAVDHWDELGTLGPAVRLKRLQGARYDAKDEAARRGIEVHRAAELLVAGKEVQVPDEIAGHVEAYARFLDEFDVEPVHVEFSAVSYRWGYAGTADLCCWLTLPERGRVLTLDDLKTSRSGVFGETALQLAAYRYADKWIVDGVEIDPLEVAFCFGIHVRGDGYDLIPVEAGEDQHKAFLYAQRVGMFASGSRDLVGGPIVPPTTSTYRLAREQS